MAQIASDLKSLLFIVLLCIQEVKLCYHNRFQPVLSYSLHSEYKKLSSHPFSYYFNTMQEFWVILKDSHFVERKDQSLN